MIKIVNLIEYKLEQECLDKEGLHCRLKKTLMRPKFRSILPNQSAVKGQIDHSTN